MRVLVLSNRQHRDFLLEQILNVPSPENLSLWTHGKCDLSQNYDIGISFMYQHRVPKEQLEKPWFNFHPAPLPDYKGRNLCYHALLNDEKVFGATVHYMDENFDTGDIIDVRLFGVEPWMTAEDLSSKSIELSKSLFVEYLPKILSGNKLTRYPNQHSIYYALEPISDQVELPPHIKNRIRAITYKEHYPKVNIGGVMYKIVKE